MNYCFTFIILCFSVVFSYSQSTAIADQFINSLTSSQKKKAVLELDDDNRTRWHYFPSTFYKREGITLKELSADQKKKLHALLNSYLSNKGYQKTLDVIEAEKILYRLSNNSNSRNPELYSVAFYGLPSKNTPWGWSFEGHHISLNFTMNGDEMTHVPRFYGANPAKTSKKIFLKNEEAMAYKLLNSLSKEQLVKAIFSKRALPDIITRNNSKVDPMKPKGIAASELTEQQQLLLFELINEYISSAPEKFAKLRMQKLKSEHLNTLYFGWAGSTTVNKPHYYCIQGSSFLIELDNTQNNANHIHSVWRDFDGDFGRNLLKEHYEQAHKH